MRRLVPVRAATQLHVERHRKLRRAGHALADDPLRRIPLPRGDLHDELIVEVAPGEKDAVEKILRTEMAGAADLTVPLDVNVGTGPTWHQAAH